MHVFIRDQVYLDIRRRELPPGAKLPTVRALARQHDVALRTSARAYELLQQEGVISLRHGLGAFVARPSHTAVAETVIFCLHPAYLNREHWIAFERLRGVFRAADRHGIDLVLATDGHTVDPLTFGSNNTAVLFFDWNYATDGFAETARKAVEMNMPCCVASGGSGCFPGVSSHREDRYCLTVEHLARLGHRRIAMLNIPSQPGRMDEGVPTGERNRQGYLGGLAQVRLPAIPEFYEESPDPEKGGPAPTLDAVDRLLSHNPCPTAIVCNNDVRAFLVMDILKSRGVRIPQDLSVSGCDNRPECQRQAPPLTSVDTRLAEQGEAAVDYLVNLLRGKKARNLNILPRLVARQSTGPAPSEVLSKQ
jgi:DNA-binding LacI/PurR family transcriptional regulator